MRSLDGIPPYSILLILHRNICQDYFAKHPVPTEYYSIGQQLQAGVSLKDIPCGTMLDSPDNLDYEVNETAEEQVLDALKKDVND